MPVQVRLRAPPFFRVNRATWPSGKARACKAFTPGSNPGVASMFLEFKMRHVFVILALIFVFSGCSNTWSGVKQDTKEAGEWTKEKVNDGATWVKEKTE